MIKKILLLLVMLLPVITFSQVYESYGGVVITKYSNVGYMIGINFIQRNKMIVGFEYANFNIEGTKIVKDYVLKENKEVSIVENINTFTLNIGVDVYDGWYLLSGVTSYDRSSNNLFVDFGVKKFIKIGNIYLSPTIKFNKLTGSFGIGYSY